MLAVYRLMLMLGLDRAADPLLQVFGDGYHLVERSVVLMEPMNQPGHG